MKRTCIGLTILLLLAPGGVAARVTAEEGERMSEITSRVESSGVTAEWHFSGDELVVEIAAPTRGWIAVGFNLSSDIVGADLFIAARQGTVTRAEHHFVVRAGAHPRVQSLGRRSALIGADVSENQVGTRVVFRLDPEHLARVRARPGEQVYLILAYSVSPDFDHHSRVWRHLSVRL